MELGDFLLARIAEDEARATGERPKVSRLRGHVLAECEAKRRIVELHAAEAGQHPDFCGHDLRMLPCPTLRLLALPYFDHPDYLQEWKP